MTDPLTRHDLRRLEKELGPDFNEIHPDELLSIAASNSFHNGKVLKELRLMATIISIIVIVIAGKLFGWI